MKRKISVIIFLVSALATGCFANLQWVIPFVVSAAILVVSLHFIIKTINDKKK